MITCSQCGALKREVNHWFVAWIERHGEQFSFAPFDADASIAMEERGQTLCGDHCLLKAVQRFSDSLAFNRDSAH
jgi:hypothetical protein